MKNFKNTNSSVLSMKKWAQKTSKEVDMLFSLQFTAKINDKHKKQVSFTYCDLLRHHKNFNNATLHFSLAKRCYRCLIFFLNHSMVMNQRFRTGYAASEV